MVVEVVGRGERGGIDDCFGMGEGGIGFWALGFGLARGQICVI